ncbi:MAG TPA: decaprenyl-phosphate phosphoribosyltransferase [Patescibacteria group bacterium]|nr:decaprenyl-phosphate phosphoribosyltransferase [Patescibacteria group bacterium]
MASLLYNILREVRPRQWIKNFALFAALVFSGFFFVPGYFSRVLIAFILFCLLSSAVYIINDIVDAPMDRAHPFKRKRPIASGAIPVSLAWQIAIILLILVALGSLALSTFFFSMGVAYVLLHIAYTYWLKHVAVLDVLTIAAGFIIRIYAGAVVVSLHMSVWFLLTVISASLFLAVGKRQSERTLLQGRGENLKEHRDTLAHYTQRLLDIYTGMFANATWVTYALYTFQRDEFVPQGKAVRIFALLPKTFTAQKWLMITVPIVIYGVMRYLQLVYEQNEGESPERVLLRDKPLLISAGSFALLVMILIYGGLG